MRLRTTWLAIVLIVLLLGSLGAAGVALAQSDSKTRATGTTGSSAPQALPGSDIKMPATGSAKYPGLQKSPLSSAYTQYLQNKAAGKVETKTVDGRGLGYIPPPVELSTKTTVKALAQAQAYPAYFNLGYYGKISPVGNQGSCGCCWTFATFGSLESYLLPGSTTRYSENHLNTLHDFDSASCQGGNAEMATAYMARWGTTRIDYKGHQIYAGPADLTSVPNPPTGTWGTVTNPASPPQQHLQDNAFLPLKQSLTDNNVIKYALMTWGGVYTAFNWNGATGNVHTRYWNPSTAAYYNKISPGGNHAVTIVGWNDNVPASYFSTTPPGNGAWIVKNSWGTSWGNGGYFYVSYYDINMGHIENAVFTGEPTTNYNTNYQYDEFGFVNSLGDGQHSTAYGANIFTASSAQTLKAVSFWTPVPATSVLIKIYVGGVLRSQMTSSITYAGYHTKKLTTPVALTNGQKFTVMVGFTTPNDYFPIPIQSYEGGYDFNVPATPAGVSWISYDGVHWYDVTTQWDPYSAVNIHAFAS